MGRALSDDPLDGVLTFVQEVVALVAIVGTVLYLPDLALIVRRLAGRVSPPPERAADPPIREVARDARRLRAELLALADGTPMARRRGLSLAYDDILALACVELDVPEALRALTPGTAEHDLERLRVEDALEAAGLRLGV